MKKLMFALCTFLIVGQIQAQTIHAGLKAGPNMAKIDDEAFKNGFKLGYQAGAWVSIEGKDASWGIQPELLFSQTDLKTTDKITAPNTKAKLNYLSIPILVKINASNLLTLHVGPQFSVLTNKDSSLWVNGKSAFKSGDFALVGGAQINLNKWHVYGRYVIGLSNVGDVVNQNSWKTQNIQIGLAYTLF